MGGTPCSASGIGGTVGAPEVRNFLGALANAFSGHTGILVTSGTLTRQAKAEAATARQPLIIVERDELADWLLGDITLLPTRPADRSPRANSLNRLLGEAARAGTESPDLIATEGGSPCFGARRAGGSMSRGSTRHREAASWLPGGSRGISLHSPGASRRGRGRRSSRRRGARWRDSMRSAGVAAFRAAGAELVARP